ncbi:MAG: PAS domain S-box protein, partial [Candidatus Cloacimonetes bacterium]|nr:PAS domain S-box protein [Candidatus Cloacimonadota bacterium]
MNKVLIIDSSEFYHNPQKDFISKELPETEIVYAANTEIAIDSCNAQLPDVVFLDEQIAIADKLQFCKKVKASDNCKDIVIILMISKNSNSEFMKDAIVAGVDSFLQKPFQPIELVSRIQVILKLTNAKRDFKQQNELLEKEVISKNNNFHTTNERFNALLQNSIDGFALVSADGIIEHVNAPFIESLKLNSDNIIDNEIIEIMRSKISETKLGQINEFFKSDNLHYTLNYDFADKYHRLKIRREKSDGGFTFIIRDISFRQNALNQVCSYKRHYKQLFDESMSAIFHIDEESKKIVDANKAAQKLISMPKHQLLNNHFSMILIDSEEQTSMLLKRIAESGKSEFIVSKQLYNSREEKKYCDLLLSYYEIEGKGMLQCTCIDVTQQKMFEQELCGSEERFRVFTDKIPACVYMKNKDGKIVFANKYMRERFLPDDWIGKKVADFFLKEKNEEIEWDDRKIINGEIHNKEEKVKDINGKDYVFASRKFALGDEKYGDLVGGIALDITDSKRARDEVNVMYKIANSILSSADLNTFFPKVREIIHSVIDSTYFYVAIYDEMSDCMKIL